MRPVPQVRNLHRILNVRLMIMIMIGADPSHRYRVQRVPRSISLILYLLTVNGLFVVCALFPRSTFSVQRATCNLAADARGREADCAARHGYHLSPLLQSSNRYSTIAPATRRRADLLRRSAVKPDSRRYRAPQTVLFCKRQSDCSLLVEQRKHAHCTRLPIHTPRRHVRNAIFVLLKMLSDAARTSTQDTSSAYVLRTASLQTSRADANSVQFPV